MADTPSTESLTEQEKLMKNIADLMTKIVELQELKNDSDTKNLETLKKQEQYSHKVWETLSKQNNSSKETLEARIKFLKKNIELNEFIIAQGNLEENQLKEHLKFIQDSTKELEKQEELLREILDYERKRKNLAKETKEEFKKTYEHILGSHSESLGLGKSLVTVSNNITEISKSLLQGDIKGMFLNMAQSIAKVFTGIFDTVKDVANELEKSRAAYSSATGQLINIADTFNGSLNNFGIGVEKLTKANVDLFSDMSNFSRLNVDVQKKLIETTAKMGNLQVSGNAVAKNFNEMTKNLRINSNQIIDVNQKLINNALAAGIAPKKMLEEFSSVMPQLASQGAKAVDIYIKMQKEAKALGMSVQELNSVVGEQFDTFEGSARAAGRLNAILGGNFLNSVDMLNASEEERVSLLKRSFDQSGISYEQLDKFQRKAIASAIAGGDVSKTNKLFGVSTAEMNKELKDADDILTKGIEVEKSTADVRGKTLAVTDALSKAMMNSTLRTEKQKVANEAFTDQAKKMNAILDSQGQAMRDLTLQAGKLADSFNSILEKIVKFSTEYPRLSLGILVTAGAVGTALATIAAGKAFSMGKKSAGGIVGRVTPTSTGEGLGGAPEPVPENVVNSVERSSDVAKKTNGFVRFMEGLRDGIQAWSVSPGKTIGGIAVMGISILAMAGIYVGISKILTYSENISLERAGQAAAVLAIFGTAAVLLGKAGSNIDKKGVMFALVTLGGIALAMLGISESFRVFSGLDYTKVDAGLITLTKVIAAFTALTLLMLIPGAAVIAGVTAGVLAGLGLALVALGRGIQAIGAGAEGFSKLVFSLQDISKIDFSKAKNLTDMEFDKLGKSLQTIPSAKVWEFKALIESLVNLNNIAPTLPTNMSMLTNEIGKISDPLTKLSGPVQVFHTLALYLKEVNTELKEMSTEKFNSLVTNIDKVRGVTSEQLKPSTEFIKAAKEFYTEQGKSKEADKDALLQVLKTFTASAGNNAGAMQVQLVVNGGDLANALTGRGNPLVTATLTGFSSPKTK